MTPSDTSIPALASHLAEHGQGRLCSFYNKKKGVERGSAGRKTVYGDSTDFVVGYAGFRYDRMIGVSLAELKALDADSLVVDFAAKGITGQVRDWTTTSDLYDDRAGLARVASLQGLDVAPDASITKLRAAVKNAGPRVVPISKQHVVEALVTLQADLEGRVLAAALRTIKGKMIDAIKADDPTAYTKAIGSLGHRATEEGVVINLTGLINATDEATFFTAWDEVEAVFQAGGAAVDHNKESFDVLTDDEGKVIRGARVYKKATGDDTSISMDEWLKRPIPGTINLQVILLSKREIAAATNGPIPRSVSGPVAVAKRVIESRLRVGQYRSYRMEPLSVAAQNGKTLEWRRYSVRLDDNSTEVYDDALEPGDTYVTVAGNKVRRGGEWGLKMGGSAVAAAEQVAKETGKALTANASASTIASI